MPTKVKVSCPTCDKKLDSEVTASDRYYYQAFDEMVELFGLTRSGKPHRQCKECFDAEIEYDRSQTDRMIEASCMFCNKKVDNLVDAKTDFGFVTGEFRPRESCRECRRGDRNDSINNIREDIAIDNYKRSVVVTGNTYEFHEAFKEFGGKFAKRLEDRDDSGWIFRKKKKGGLITLLQKEKKIAEKVEEKRSGCEKCNGELDDYGLYLICKNCGNLEHKNLE